MPGSNATLDSTVTVFFISGATRGLGLGFVSQIASKYPDAVVYAGARDPSGTGADALRNLSVKYPGRIEVMKYVSADEEGNKEVARGIEERYGRVDVVIANAAICGGLAPVQEIDVAQFNEHFRVNVAGPIVLFKAFYRLFKASTNPKFIPITSVGGSLVITVSRDLQGTCYCSSKAALNWVARKIHFENDWLVCFPFSPGGVDTDMLRDTAAQDTTGTFSKVLENEEILSPDAAASKMMDIIMSATRENDGGQYVNIDGSRLPW